MLELLGGRMSTRGVVDFIEAGDVVDPDFRMSGRCSGRRHGARRGRQGYEEH